MRTPQKYAHVNISTSSSARVSGWITVKGKADNELQSQENFWVARGWALASDIRSGKAAPAGAYRSRPKRADNCSYERTVAATSQLEMGAAVLERLMEQDKDGVQAAQANDSDTSLNGSDSDSSEDGSSRARCGAVVPFGQPQPDLPPPQPANPENWSLPPEHA